MADAGGAPGPRAAIPMGPLARRDGEPLFEEPWQAQTMAIASRLVEVGVITADAWSQRLGAEIRAKAAAGAPDDTTTYFESALAALRGLLRDLDLVTDEALALREDAWARAYRNTPHGEPVELARGR